MSEGSEQHHLPGIGDGGVLLNDRWYRIEMHVKMNTPGQADGVIEGKVDGILSYEKKNMIFRIPGHDNLHVRTIWLDVFKGALSATSVISRSISIRW